MDTVRAAVCREFNKPLVVEEITVAPPGPGEVAVRVDHVAICHSDISFIQGGWGGVLPAVYGHEAAGFVEAVGSGVTGVAPGDTVLVTLLRACRHCTACEAGKPAYCATPRPEASPFADKNGKALHQAMATGAFAEMVVVDRSQVALLPAGIDLAAASLLSCGVVTGIGGVIHAGALRAGEDVVVIGAGGVGLNAIQGARIGGARRVVAVDLSDTKLEDARGFGATDTVRADHDAPWQEVIGLLGKGADMVVVSVGAQPAFEAAPRYLAPQGRMVLIGMPHGDGQASWPMGDLVAMGQKAIGSKMGDVVPGRDFPWLIDLYAQGRLQLDELVSRVWTLDEINEAIADTLLGGARRNVIRMRQP